VKEQSHKDEMSAALRGDFARLRDRGVAATFLPHDVPEADVPEADGGGAAPVEAAPDRLAELDENAPEEAAADAPQRTDEPVRRSWLTRLAGR
jgi:hypothetical protein